MLLLSGDYRLMPSGLGWKLTQDSCFIHLGAPFPSWESILINPCTDRPDHKIFSDGKTIAL